MNKIFFISLVSLLVSSPVFAEGWSGELGLSGSQTTGNTDTTDLGASIKVKKSTDKWQHNVAAYIDYGRDNGQTNKQRFGAGYQLDYKISDHVYVYGNSDYFDDDFGAFKNGFFLGGGAGYHIWASDSKSGQMEIGVGYRRQATQDPVLPAMQPASLTQNEFALRGRTNFHFQFNTSVSLNNESIVLYASDDTYLWNEVALNAKLGAGFAARISFRVDHHTEPPVGRESTDTISRIGITYTLN